MTAAKFPLKVPSSHAPQASLPTMYDLPSEDPEEPGLPDEYHLWQADLCSVTFRPPTYPPERVFVASDLNLYYDPQHTRWYKRPDWFAVIDVPRLYQNRELRLSYVIWQEKVSPIVAIEFLSPSTQTEDLGKRPRRGVQPTKWEVYEQILAIPHYIVFNRYTDELRAFRLENGRYRERPLPDTRVWLPELALGLGLWQGEYRGVNRQWLRWYDQDGNWMLTETEQERQQKEQERQQKEAAQLQAAQERQQKEAALEAQAAALEAQAAAEQRAQQLEARLQQLGIDPDQI